MSESRKMTNKILVAVEEGGLDSQEMLEMCLNYMSEADVVDMCESNDLFEEEEEE